MHDDFREQRQLRPHFIPDPAREIFAGRIFQAGDLVQIVMIELIVGGLERRADIGEIHDPSGVWIDIAAKMQLDAKRVPMQSRAFVPGGHMRQAMRRLDRECAKDIQLPIPFLSRARVDLRQPCDDASSTHSCTCHRCSESSCNPNIR